MALALMVLPVSRFRVPLLQQVLPGTEEALKCKARYEEEMRQKALKLRHTVRTPSPEPFPRLLPRAAAGARELLAVEAV